MSWALIRNKAPYEGSLVPSGWVFAPQLGPKMDTTYGIEEPEHRYLSLLDGLPVSEEEAGKPGRGYGFTIEHDRVDYVNLTVKCHAGNDNTMYLMGLDGSANSIREMLTDDMRADLLSILGPLTDEEMTRHA